MVLLTSVRFLNDTVQRERLVKLFTFATDLILALVCAHSYMRKLLRRNKYCRIIYSYFLSACARALDVQLFPVGLGGGSYIYY